MYLLVNNKRYTEIDKQGQAIEIEFKSLIKQNNDVIATTVEDRKFIIGNPNWENLSVEGGEFQTKVTKEEFLTKTTTELKIDNLKKDKMIKELGQQISNINLQILKRGAK